MSIRNKLLGFLIVLLILGLPVLAHAQNVAIGTISAAGDEVKIGAYGQGTFSIQVIGSFSGTIAFQVTLNGATWVAANGYPPDSTTAATSTTTAGVWTVCGAFTQIRAYASSWTSGTPTVLILANP